MSYTQQFTHLGRYEPSTPSSKELHSLETSESCLEKHDLVGPSNVLSRDQVFIISFRNLHLCLKTSVTRLGDFIKFWATNFLCKVAQIYSTFFGYFKVCHFLILNCLDTLWATIAKFWSLLIPAFGHTAHDSKKCWGQIKKFSIHICAIAKAPKDWEK